MSMKMKIFVLAEVHCRSRRIVNLNLDLSFW